MHNNKPSATAGLILQSIVFISKDSRLKYLVPAELAEVSAKLLETKAINKKRFLATINVECFRRLIWFMEHLFLPGIILHYILRKRYIEQISRNMIDKGKVTQVIILAAGFDSLAYRLSQDFPHVNFIEADHPATQCVKEQALKELDLHTSNIIFLPIDLSKEDLTDKLLSLKQFNPQAETLFIAEGITMYLTANQIDQLFNIISSSASSKSRFIFTFMDRQENGSIDFKNTHVAINLWLKLKKERFIWGIPKKEMPSFLNNRRFSIMELVSHDTLKTKYLSSDECLAEGECICITKAN